MTEEKRRAIWAIYVWCRRTDELVDGPNASHIDPVALDRWEDRLESFLRRRRAFSVDHEAAATPKKRTKRAPARKTFAPPAAAKAAPKQEAPPPPRLARAQSWAGE